MTSFVGPPCGQYGPYVFHKGFKFLNKDKFRVINLGEFFFVRISLNHDPCIGELQLLWNDQNSDQKLSSVRLYFLPEQTPEGRLSTHGEDEVLVASDNVVLKLDDLVSWITDEVDWNHGLRAICEDDILETSDSQLQNFVTSVPCAAAPIPAVGAVDTAEGPAANGTDKSEDHQQPTAKDAQIKVASQLKEEKSSSEGISVKEDDEADEVRENGDKAEEPSKNEDETLADDSDTEKTEESSAVANISGADSNNSNSGDQPTTPAVPVKATEIKCGVKEKNELADIVMDKDELRVLVLSYPSYCRYRSMLKRLDGITEKWLKHALVVALGGFTTFGRNTHILFCRDTFEHEELAHHELNCEYLAPTLKVKRRRKKGKNARSTSPGSESNTSEESKEVVAVKESELKNGFKPLPYKSEQEFLQRLYKFMKKRKTPIHRVPHLGFKQIDLFVFFSFAQKLGGYDKITGKKLWKHVYDELGGDPGSTSAATCTRRHYEKLLLPFERFMDGKEYKPKPPSRKSPKPSSKKLKEDNENSETGEKSSAAANEKTDDAYTFTDSNHENSKDSSTPNDEQQQSGEDGAGGNDNYSDEDDKPIWVIQKAAAAAKEASANESSNDKQVKPLVIQKEPNESFSEKERRWNEIRKKNALARKRVRQLRPSRGVKTCSSEKYPVSDGDTAPKQTTLAVSEAPVKIEPLSVSLPADPVHAPSLSALSSQQQQQPLQQPSQPQIKQESNEPPQNLNQTKKQRFQDKLQAAAVTQHVHDGRSHSADGNEKKAHQPPKIAEQFAIAGKFQVKAEPVMTTAVVADKQWSRYPSEIPPYSFTPDRYPYGFDMNMLRNFIKQPLLQNKSSGYTKPSTVNNNSSESLTYSASDTELTFVDGKPNLSQRRPSVIQHTEFITTPSPSPSPKQMSSEAFSDTASRDSIGSGSGKIPLQPSLSHTPPVAAPTTLNKTFPEWLAKGIPEAVACKTPTSLMEKASELHDKVMMPSSCKTVPLATNKAAMHISRSKADIQNYMPTPAKAVRDKTTASYCPVNVEATKRSANFPITNNTSAKLTPMYQKSYLPPTTMASSLNLYYKQNMKSEQQGFIPVDKSKQYVEPLYSQPKRQRLQTVTPSAPLPPRPSLLPFNRQQTYRTSPLSDIPKTALMSSRNNYETEVLDLSVKKYQEKPAPKPMPVSSVTNVQTINEEPILDLSMKKKPNTAPCHPSPIENITPPLPSSPPKSAFNHSAQINPKPLKPLPTLIALQDLMKEDVTKQRILHGVSISAAAAASSSSGSITSGSSSNAKANSSHTSATGIQTVTIPSPNAVMFPGTSQSKVKSNYIAIPPTFTKEMAESLYMQTDPSQFPPYVIPPFYAAHGWPAAESGLPSANSTTSSSSSSSSPSSKNASTSLNNFKESMGHGSGVFPKQYLYNYKHPYHPMLCKDNGFYPPSCK